MSTFARSFAQRTFEADYRAMLHLADRRKAENARARARCQANQALCAVLLEQALRRGEPGIDWDAYFSNLGILR